MDLAKGAGRLESFIYSVNASLPVFLTMAAGLGLRRLGLLDGHFADVADRFVFKVTLPLMLFQQIRAVDIYHSFNAGYLAFCAGATLASILAAWALARRLVRPRRSIGAFVQACYRSSAAILGLAFIQNIYGTAGQAGLMVLGSVPLFNLFAVVVLALEGGAADRPLKEQLAGAAKGVATNPIILGILAGFAAALIRLPVPTLLDRTLENFAGLTTPLALVAIGVNFDFRAAMATSRLALIASAVKLLVLPAVFLPLAAALGFRQQLFMGLIVMLGSPCTPTSYVMAKSLGADAALAGAAVMLTTLASSASLTFWIFLWHSLGVL